MRNALWHDIMDELAAERAAANEAGASDQGPVTLVTIARGSHAQHSASDTIIDPSVARDPVDVSEGELPQGGGASDVVVVERELSEAEFDIMFPPRLTWLERITRRWPARVS